MCLAIPAQISELESESFATVDILGARRRVSIELLVQDPPVVGEWVLVHVGFAMTKISSADAEEQLKLLAELGESFDDADSTNNLDDDKSE